ncbi:MAG: hypothetical protein CMJ48_09885 [Planctomycetaceae bacterium]|nr:hypothetical protein [Planctomycetaceae bacterium]
MYLFRDGLGEIAINGKDDSGGPHMIRLPDGTSIIATRLANGNPGASLVTQGEGTSVVAASSQDGKRSISLRTTLKDAPALVVVDPKGEKKAPPEPKAVPRAPRGQLLGIEATP